MKKALHIIEKLKMFARVPYYVDPSKSDLQGMYNNYIKKSPWKTSGIRGIFNKEEQVWYLFNSTWNHTTASRLLGLESDPTQEMVIWFENGKFKELAQVSGNNFNAKAKEGLNKMVSFFKSQYPRGNI